jgi:HAMP domain-containing protein
MEGEMEKKADKKEKLSAETIMQKKRRTILVDKGFQFRIIRAFLLSVLGGLFLVSLLFVGFYWFSSLEGVRRADERITIETRVFREIEQKNEAGELKTEIVPITKQVTGRARWEIVLPPLMLNNLLIMAIVIVVGMVLSFRIAGPVVHIQRVVQNAVNGKKGGRINLRKKDSLKGLADDINTLLDTYESGADKAD